MATNEETPGGNRASDPTPTDQKEKNMTIVQPKLTDPKVTIEGVEYVLTTDELEWINSTLDMSADGRTPYRYDDVEEVIQTCLAKRFAGIERQCETFAWCAQVHLDELPKHEWMRMDDSQPFGRYHKSAPTDPGSLHLAVYETLVGDAHEFGNPVVSVEQAFMTPEEARELAVRLLEAVRRVETTTAESEDRVVVELDVDLPLRASITLVRLYREGEESFIQPEDAVTGWFNEDGTHPEKGATIIVDRPATDFEPEEHRVVEYLGVFEVLERSPGPLTRYVLAAVDEDAEAVVR